MHFTKRDCVLTYEELTSQQSAEQDVQFKEITTIRADLGRISSI